MKILKIDKKIIDYASVNESVKAFNDGKIIIFPTETVYGVGTKVTFPESIKKIYEIKGRDFSKPLAYHFGSLEQFFEFSKDSLDSNIREWFSKIIPNPATLIYYDKNVGKKIGVRIVNDPVSQIILSELKEPVLATSANFSGEKSPCSMADIPLTFQEKVDLVIDAGMTEVAKESTVIDLSFEKPKILRQGAYTLKKVIGFICTGNTCRSPMAEAYFKFLVKDMPIEVFSAGISAGYGWKATEEAISVMRSHNIDLSKHISKPLTDKLFKEADMLVVMTEMHRESILYKWPNANNKVFLLRELDKNHDLSDINVFDPVGCPLEIYHKCFELMKNSLNHLGELVCKE